jgi:hypothetical protein
MTDQTRARTPDEVSAAVECAIGLNVDCGGAEGVYRVRDAVLDAIRPELDALAALRTVARGYCPHCGRGDAAPTVTDWEQQKQRADQVEELLHIAHETSNKSEAERARAVQRAERVEALLAEILDAFDPLRADDGTLLHHQARVFPRQFEQWQRALEVAGRPAHNAGPTVAECAANDRAYWESKDAGDQP